MQILDWISGSSMHIPPWEAFLRLLAAVIVGAVVGFDRELRNKPAGLRTHMMVALGAACFTLAAFTLEREVTTDFDVRSRLVVDPTRVVEGIIGGIGFLGAGAIIRDRGTVEGLTTAGSIWLVGAIGVAAGAGHYLLGGTAVLLAVVILFALGHLERWMDRRRGKHLDEPRGGEPG
jgi:putative Mg2+ transporter-C (MgtC) family protein